MIKKALTFLMQQLNGELKQTDPKSKVLFVGEDVKDPSSFHEDAVTVMVVGIEEEKTLRAADPYMRTSSNGTSERVRPDIRLNLYVLFVAPTKSYQTGLHYLSRIIQHFQKHRVFDHRGETELSDGDEQLIMELHTQSLSEQHELWQALGTAYRPSVLYKVKMVVFSDEAGETIRPIEETELSVRRLP